MSEPVPHLSDAQIQRLLADISQPSVSLTAEDLRRLEELVRRVGSIEAAQELFEALEELDLDGEMPEELDAAEVELDDDADDDDLNRVAA